MKSTLISFILGITSLTAEELSPTLQVLPLNSRLRQVIIPRYDSSRQRVAYLSSDLMEVLADGEETANGQQPIMVDCTDLSLQMKTSLHGNIAVGMERARYRMVPGILSVSEKITATSPTFQLQGDGAIFHLDTRRGFLFGPIHCGFVSDKLHSLSSLSSMNISPIFPLIPLLVSTQELSYSQETRPTTSKAELARVETLARSSKPSIEKLNRAVEEQETDNKSLSKKADMALSDFQDTVDSESLTRLIVATQEEKQEEPETPAPLKNPDITITCDGGCFFDGNQNLLVLLRNVVVNERRFTLTARNELKVFFLSEEPKEDKDEDDLSSLNITDIDRLAATGGVNFSGIDKDGNPVEATAETATYEDQTKTLFLKGGKPTFWIKKGKAQFQLQAANESAHVKIEMGPDGLTAVTSEDGWKIGGKDIQR